MIRAITPIGRRKLADADGAILRDAALCRTRSIGTRGITRERMGIFWRRRLAIGAVDAREAHGVAADALPVVLANLDV